MESHPSTDQEGFAFMCGMSIFGVMGAEAFFNNSVQVLCFAYVTSGHLCIS